MKVSTRLRQETITGGGIVARMLAAEGVSKVFGIIDGTYFGMYSAFGGQGIDLVTPRHETSAVHMAGTYARATAKLGVCMASNGPGVANALPGVAVEEAEGNRVLLITSSRREGIIHPDRGGTFQYFPQVEVIGAMAKWSCAVPSIERVAELVRRAMRVAWTGRPGVVHLEIPESVMNGRVALNEAWFQEPSQYRSTTPITPTPLRIAEAVRLIAKAKRPLIHAGSGVLHAAAFEQLVAVAERFHMPITTSWAARAVVDERHPLAVPMLYVGTVNQARKEADLVLVLGSRLGETDWWGKAPYWAPPEKQQIIQVDLDAERIGCNRPVALGIQADVGQTLSALASHPITASAPPATRVKWAQKLGKACAARRTKLDRHRKKDTLPLHSAHVAPTCQEVLGDDAILVIDGGNTAIWAHFYHEVRTPNSVFTTPKMGMLGAGMSQALAAQVAHPDRQVYCIIGDGAMGFHPQEIETAVRNQLPVIWLVLCDKQWGMVKINQQFALKPIKTLIKKSLSPEETINADLGEIEFDQLARSMGAYGERVADPAGLRGAIERAVSSGRPAVIHVDVDPTAHMWAPNLKDFKDMHAEPAG